MTSAAARMDLSIAAELVRRATALAVEARRGLPPEAIVEKPDGSVVTAVDVALQVFVLDALERAYGAIPTIAEEDLASIGGKPAAEAHCAALLRSWGFDGGADRVRWALSSGALDGSTRGLERVWILDPIDGTQGFIDGAHWCPCLALLAHGEVVFGANGHPTVARERFEGGVALAAERGGGTWMRAIAAQNPASTRASVSTERPAPGDAVRVVASARSTPSQDRFRREVGESTGHPATLVHSDSQTKYGLVIAGDADIAYSRRGAGPGKYVWDHAGAILLAREAGAWVGDTDGRDIDCSQGRRLSANRAVICAARGLGPAVAAKLAARDVEEGLVPGGAHGAVRASCAG
jgi:3'(2'), 5'-bisphosphate nucleotidase